MSQEKWIYTFTLDQEVQIEKTEAAKDANGADIKITKTVTEKRPFTFSLKKPNRRIIEEADIFYASKVGEYLKAGLLSRNLIAKRYENDGGEMSESSKSLYEKSLRDLFELKIEEEKLSQKIKEENKEEDKSALETLRNQIVSARTIVTEFEIEKNALYENSAESKAFIRQISWFVLHLTYWNKGSGENFEPYFVGKNFEEKNSDYEKKEEEMQDSVFFSLLTSKLSFALSFWLNSTGKIQQEDIQKAMDSFS